MNRILYIVPMLIILASQDSLAQQSMTMAGMENSVGTYSSGTSLEPLTTSETSPVIHKPIGPWTFMFHANAFLVDVQQSGARGGDKFYSTSWVMPMFTRTFGSNTLTVRTMFSFEPATVTDRRYPLLFQTGETAFGRAIVDGQHPHELIMELAGRFDHALGEKTGLYAYGGPVGEPALGPPAFPHRASASENPSAVLSHHYQDSTHLSNNVITLGFVGGPVQLEASTFHGGEPNENRWNVDKGALDSFSSRLTVAAGKTLVGQFSMGRINDREPSDPGMDTLRTTASLQHNVRFSGGHIASSLIWGRNKDMDDAEQRIFNSYTLESTVNFGSNWAWTRIENLDRDASLLSGEISGHLDETPIGRVQAWTFGYERELPLGAAPIRIGLGAQATVYGLADILKPIYGERPTGVAFFLRFRPKGNMMLHMQGMHQR